MENLFDNNSGAEFSECRKYRYKLWRIWNDSLPYAMCIGLNPSNANEFKTDPTITNLIKMLKKLGYGGFYMMNLFAWVSSKPKDLLLIPDPIGENNNKMDEVEKLCSDIIFCWGSFPEADKISGLIIQKYPNAKCFGITKESKPLHPLALMYAGKTDNPYLYDFAKVKER